MGPVEYLYKNQKYIYKIEGRHVYLAGGEIKMTFKTAKELKTLKDIMEPIFKEREEKKRTLLVKYSQSNSRVDLKALALSLYLYGPMTAGGFVYNGTKSGELTVR